MLDRSEVGKRGYLNDDYRIVHLKDSLAPRIGYHYHEFDKLVFFLGGKVTYAVEGVTYYLKPGDILLVQHNMIHRPMIDPSEPYERVVLWLSRTWMERCGSAEEPLDRCFEIVRETGFHLIRTEGERRAEYAAMVRRLEEAQQSEEFGSGRMADTTCQQILIMVTRDVLRTGGIRAEQGSYRTDPKIEEVWRFIATHPAEDLSVDALAGRFYLNRHYLMHRFKEITGSTLHQYVNQKRIQLAGDLIRKGMPVMKAAESAGFTEYSTFLRVFRAAYHTNPRSFR